jgi:hypothetical protein
MSRDTCTRSTMIHDSYFRTHLPFVHTILCLSKLPPTSDNFYYVIYRLYDTVTVKIGFGLGLGVGLVL